MQLQPTFEVQTQYSADYGFRQIRAKNAVVDIVYNKTRFEDDDMRDHRIVLGVGIFSDVEILLNFRAGWDKKVQ